MKKKLSATKLVLLLLSTMFVLLVATVLTSLFWPSPPIIVSKETTYILGPLNEYGNVDYVAALEQKYGGDLPPEKNAAYYYLQAKDPSNAEVAAMYEEFGIDPLQREDFYLQAFHQFAEQHPELMAETRRVQGLPTGSSDNETEDQIQDESLESGDDAEAERLTLLSDDEVIWYWDDLSKQQPWKRSEFPVVAAFLETQEGPLQFVHRGAQQERCFFPFVLDPDEQHGRMLEIALPFLQGVRDAARVLNARAMLRAGEGETEAAFDDIKAMLTLGHHAAEQPSLVGNLVGIAVSGLASSALSAILHETEPTPEQLARLADWFDTLPPQRPMAKTLDFEERFVSLDIIAAFAAGHDFGDTEFDTHGSTPGVDWNIVLRRINMRMDQVVEIAETPPGQERKQLVKQFEADMEAISFNSKNKRRWFGGVFSRRLRSEMVSDWHLALLTPAIEAAVSAEDRSRTRRDLLRVAIALTRYRADHDIYPDELKQLVPKYLREIPIDRFSDVPLRYRKTKDGYKLYSVGPNRQDNGGLDATMDDTGELDYEVHDDYSLHQPQPIPRAPWLPEQAGELEQEPEPDTEPLESTIED